MLVIGLFMKVILSMSSISLKDHLFIVLSSDAERKKPFIKTFYYEIKPQNLPEMRIVSLMDNANAVTASSCESNV